MKRFLGGAMSVLFVLGVISLASAQRPNFAEIYLKNQMEQCAAQHGDYLRALPLAVADAVRSSQGAFCIGYLKRDGSYQWGYTNAVLFGDNQHVLAPGHSLEERSDLAFGKNTIYVFNGVRAEYAASKESVDLAIFKLAEPISGMKPAVLADGYAFGKTYFGASFLVPSGYANTFSAVLNGEDRKNSPDERPSFLFLDRGAEHGNSGSPVWDEGGKLVGIESATTQDNSLTRFVSLDVLREVTKNFSEVTGREAEKTSSPDVSVPPVGNDKPVLSLHPAPLAGASASAKKITASPPELDFDKFPEPVKAAIKASQGEVAIVMPTLMGENVVYQGNGLLLEGSLVLTSSYLLPKFPALLSAPTTQYFFNGHAARYLMADMNEGFAVLVLTEPAPEHMKPASIADDLSVPPVGSFNGIAYTRVDKNEFFVTRIEVDAEGSRQEFSAVPSGLTLLGSPVWRDDGKLAFLFTATPQGKGAVAVASDIAKLVAVATAHRKSQKSLPGISPGAPAASKLSLEDQKAITDATQSFVYILQMHALQSLHKPEDLWKCAEEMFSLKQAEEGSCRDRHTSWMSPEVSEEMSVETAGKFGGIGMEMTEKDGKILVIAPMDDTPASHAGVQSGDEVVSVDDTAVAGQDLRKIVERIRGKIGTTVKVGFSRNGVPYDAVLTRAAIHIQYVKTKVLPGDIGYLRIAQFSETVGEDTARELKKMRDKNISRVVLDLRNDPGGEFLASLQVLASFARESDISVSILHRDTREVFNQKYAREVIRNLPEPRWFPDTVGEFRDMKVVVLVNRGSASASEIVAGAMQDWGYPVVGTRSFGKGVGQVLAPLARGSKMRMTVFEFLPGNSGVKIHDRGVVPTYSIGELFGYGSGSRPARDPSEDPALDKAVELLSQ